MRHPWNKTWTWIPVIFTDTVQVFLLPKHKGSKSHDHVFLVQWSLLPKEKLNDNFNFVFHYFKMLYTILKVTFHLQLYSQYFVITNSNFNFYKIPRVLNSK